MGFSAGALLRDPLLIKEFRTRLRARTVLAIELLYIIGVCGIVFLGFLLTRDMDQSPGWELGAAMFRVIAYLQAVLMLFVAPLVSASMISGEKEQKTFDSLCVTPTSPRHIVIAKLIAALALFVVLVFASLPIACVSFILGGVAPADLLLAYGLTLLTTATAGALGLYWSTRFERSIASIPAAAVCAVLAVAAVPQLGETCCKAVSSVSPVVFLEMLSRSATVPFFKAACPFWVPAAAFHLLAFLYLVAASIGRMHFPAERRYVLQRLLAFLLFLCLSAFYMGECIAGAGGDEVPNLPRYRVGQCVGFVTVALTLLAPWVGANLRVLRSEARSRAGRRGLVGAIGSMLTRPARFMFLLLAVAAPLLAYGLRVADPPNLSHGAVWLAYWGATGLSVLTWTLLSLRLSDRRTAKGRYIGMALAYLVTGFFVISAPVGIEVGGGWGEPPQWVQYASLLSPMTSVSLIGRPVETKALLDAVIGRFGDAGPMLLTSGLYLAACLVLLLPIYRRAFRTGR